MRELTYSTKIHSSVQHDGATDEGIDKFFSSRCLARPLAYRMFLLRYNGGCFNEGFVPATPLGPLVLSDIDGPSERDIYVCGSFPGPAGLEGRLFHFEGAAWHRIDIPETGYLNRILIESPESIWICGHNGALLNGNARSGFKDISSVEDNQLFYSMARFGQKRYLGSNLGLYEYELNDPQAKIREVVTDLIPPVRDAVTVDTVSKVLWSIGEKDIVRFDGSAWTRVDHPDNPPPFARSRVRHAKLAG